MKVVKGVLLLTLSLLPPCTPLSSPGRAVGEPSPRADGPPSPRAGRQAGGAALDGLVSIAALAPSIVLEPRYAGANNFTGRRLPGYVDGQVRLHREAAAALARVQRGLEEGPYGLKVFDGHRPYRASLAMVRWAQSTGQGALLEEGYIAGRSRHNLGLAVDLTLVVRSTGEEVAMGTAFDTFAPAAHTANAAGAVLANRRRLARAMEAEGFAAYAKEWWHFSWKPTSTPR